MTTLEQIRKMQALLRVAGGSLPFTAEGVQALETLTAYPTEGACVGMVSQLLRRSCYLAKVVEDGKAFITVGSEEA